MCADHEEDADIFRQEGADTVFVASEALARRITDHVEASVSTRIA
jgi:hypothetical protein